MPVLSPKLDVALSSVDLPSPVMFRSAHVPPDGLYPQHRHAWGEFVYSFSGVMEVKVAGHHYLAPPQYGVWLPPRVVHVGLNRQASHHCSLYIAPSGCSGLPDTPCALTVSPVVRALLDHLRQQPPGTESTPTGSRLLQVLVDLLEQAPRARSYLPHSDDALLAPLLAALHADPGANDSLAQWAARVHTTERTLARRSQQALGMSLPAWRQRLRVLRSLPRLEAGDKVESIARDLGYGSASAFIAMFRKLMGVTPDEFRKGVPAGTGKRDIANTIANY